MYNSKQKLKNLFLLSVFLTITFFNNACKPKNYVTTRIEGKQISIDSTLVGNADFEKFILPYRTKVDAEMNKILAYAPINLTKERSEPETTMGNFMADLSYRQANPKFFAKTGKNIDFVLLNIGGVRSVISKGDVNVRKAFEIMPFENLLVVVELTYDKIMELTDYYNVSKNAHPVSSQLQLTFKDNKLESAMLNKQPFEQGRTYFVLTNDYVANGGDNMNFFLNPVSFTALDYKVRDALIDELVVLDTIRATLDGRVIRQ